jgi:hypothetical protein
MGEGLNVDDVVYWATWAFLQLGGGPGRSEDIPRETLSLPPTFTLTLVFSICSCFLIAEAPKIQYLETNCAELHNRQPHVNFGLP